MIFLYFYQLYETWKCQVCACQVRCSGKMYALKKMESRGNPWGMQPRKRDAWTEGMEVPRWDAEKPSEWLYWVGCAGSYDDRAQKVTRAFVRLMQTAGVDFAILEERFADSEAVGRGREALDRLVGQGLAERDGKRYWLNDEGRMLADAIGGELVGIGGIEAEG